MNNLVKACIEGLVVSFICWIIKTIYQDLRYYRKSKYSGKWINEIYDENNQIIKRDVTKLKHNKRTNYVTGKVSRIYPFDQVHKKWKCSGVVSTDHIIVSFWPKGLIKSDGCVYASLVEDYTYEGFYLQKKGDSIRKIKIRLTKEKKN